MPKTSVYTTGRARRLLVDALDGCPASFPWLCKGHPMDGTLKTLNRTFLDKEDAQETPLVGCRIHSAATPAVRGAPCRGCRSRLRATSDRQL
ncbi:uncharacterized protein PGTG_17857 [Puccinia graminis f. sp. tritici CRL 75-36-700-3]|uniref:Uncharacterized protein n=1 Tax=Puccinia graminis f. sp. tritici (strain CRL 75-36-700-3 / race SCCL) TaxID=418459 RepID=E3L651_PUCGT|nr:uncharacterized protein PGTG_17857 [Puccinia graminis f. sp. tritici CRL 75-36-700-3]EFP92026.2 hypothetical protein PGTG_17857 [Puccinia graminis f. sp. tritici CRL 75-36-700-3]